MERIVGARLSFRFLFPGLKGIQHRVALVLGRKIHYRRRAAADRRSRPGSEVIRGKRPRDRQVQMRMPVDKSRKYIAA